MAWEKYVPDGYQECGLPTQGQLDLIGSNLGVMHISDTSFNYSQLIEVTSNPLTVCELGRFKLVVERVQTNYYMTYFKLFVDDVQVPDSIFVGGPYYYARIAYSVVINHELQRAGFIALMNCDIRIAGYLLPSTEEEAQELYRAAISSGHDWQSVAALSGQSGLIHLSTLVDVNDGEPVITYNTSKFVLTDSSNVNEMAAKSKSTLYLGADAGGVAGNSINSGNQSTGYAFGLGESSSNSSCGGGGLYGGYKAVVKDPEPTSSVRVIMHCYIGGIEVRFNFSQAVIDTLIANFDQPHSSIDNGGYDFFNSTPADNTNFYFKREGGTNVNAPTKTTYEMPRNNELIFGWNNNIEIEWVGNGTSEGSASAGVMSNEIMAFAFVVDDEQQLGCLYIINANTDSSWDGRAVHMVRLGTATNNKYKGMSQAEIK